VQIPAISISERLSSVRVPETGKTNGAGGLRLVSASHAVVHTNSRTQYEAVGRENVFIASATCSLPATVVVVHRST
jgi:hypothetical protein